MSKKKKPTAITPVTKLQLPVVQQVEKGAEGLELLDDETLAAIVDGDVSEYGDVKTERGEIAFNELARRSGYHVSR